MFVEQRSRNSLVTVATREELKNVQEEIENIEVTGFETHATNVHVQRGNNILVHSVLMAELSILRADAALNVVHKVEREDCDLQHNTPVFTLTPIYAYRLGGKSLKAESSPMIMRTKTMQDK